MIVWTVIFSLVTYRATRFLIEDSLIDTPRDWLKKTVIMRGKIPGVRYNPNPTPAWRSKLYELTECPYCVSVWVALASVGCARLTGASVPQPFWVWLASAGGCMIVWSVVED